MNTSPSIEELQVQLEKLKQLEMNGQRLIQQISEFLAKAKEVAEMQSVLEQY